MAIVKLRFCRRLAITQDQGLGWSEYTGDEWIQPRINGGAVLISDANDCPRLVFDCGSNDDPGLYESGTYDQLQFSGPAYQDKNGVESTDIEWWKWMGEVVVDPRRQNETLELLESHVFIRPQIPLNDGRSGYDSHGMVDGFELDIDDYTEGDQRTPIGKCTNVPVDGDITFSGVRVEGRRHQFVIHGNKSEVKVTGVTHNFLSKPRPVLQEDATDGGVNAQSVLASGLLSWLNRGKLAYDRVAKSQLKLDVAQTVPASCLDPENRYGAFNIPMGDSLTVFQVPVGGAYAIGVRSAGSTIMSGASSEAVVGDVFNGYEVFTATLTASTQLVLGVGCWYDVRVIPTNPAPYATEYYNNTHYSGGYGFMPVY